MPPTTNSSKSKPFFGMKIDSWERFITSVFSYTVLIGTIVIFGTQIYLKEDFKDEKEKAVSEVEKEKKALEQQIQILNIKVAVFEQTRNTLTKEDLERFAQFYYKQTKANGNK